MTEFEKVLQGCLHDLEQGASSLDECLSRHPDYALQLEPVLLASVYLERAGEARVSDAFKARVRARLVQGMVAQPRRRAPSGFPLMRLAIGLAVLLFALLTTGTVYAQSALPGEAFYAWKLASERAWRFLSPDPVGTDIAIAERRVDELLAVRDNPALYTEVLEAYAEVADRLRNEMDAETEALILGALEAQIEELNQPNIMPDEFESDQEVLPTIEEPTPTPTATPLPVLQTPRIDPTDVPQIVPTVQVSEPAIDVPPVVIPTVEDSPEIVPTIEIPLPIP